MSFQWNSKYAIMKDLSLAQGFNVPIDVDDMIGAGEKPPALDLLEETEEEYFSSYTGGFHDNEGPDLNSIKEMLSLVKEANEEDDNTSIMLQETMLRTAMLPKDTDEEIKTKTETSTDNVERKPIKIKRGTNVALDSIMQSSVAVLPTTQNASSTEISKPLLLKPDYFIGEDVTKIKYNNKTENGAIKKDSVILDRISKKKKPILEFQPHLMYKKKISPLKPKEGCFEETVPSETRDTSPKINREMNTVSNCNGTISQEAANNNKKALEAKELFKTYINLVNIKKDVVNDVWSRAERQMKAIDDTRNRQLSESELKESFPDMSMEEAQRLKLVLLPRHRHYLPEDCIVCEVEYKHQMKQKQVMMQYEQDLLGRTSLDVIQEVAEECKGIPGQKC